MTQDLTKYYDNEKIELIKKTVCPGSSDEELALFLHVCQKAQLDPLTKQIYSIKRGNNRTIQVGIDGLRSIAERTGKYSPGKESVFVYDDKKKLVSATVYIKKMTVDGTWHEIGCTAFLAEYYSNMGLWSKLPHVMLEKVAEARALKRAFPQEMCGLLTDDEMDQAKPVDVVVSSEKIEEQKYIEVQPGKNIEVSKKKEDPLISAEQVDQLTSLIEPHDTKSQQRLNKALSAWGYKSLADLKLSEFDCVEQTIKKWTNKN